MAIYDFVIAFNIVIHLLYQIFNNINQQNNFRRKIYIPVFFILIIVYKRNYTQN